MKAVVCVRMSTYVGLYHVGKWVSMVTVHSVGVILHGGRIVFCIVGTDEEPTAAVFPRTLM